MKHTVGAAVWRGLPVGQMEPRNLFNENFVDSYPRNLSSAKLRRYTVSMQASFSLVSVKVDRQTAISVHTVEALPKLSATLTLLINDY